jgi:hypothetical protein
MSQTKIASETEKRAEHDFSGGVRGKHHEAYKNGGLLDFAREQASVKKSA